MRQGSTSKLHARMERVRSKRNHGTGLTRRLLPRLQFIVQRILTGEHANNQTLAREYEVSSKCIQRDVELLRDELGHRIEYDAKHWTWRYTEPPEPLFWTSPPSPPSRDITSC